jgi:hypothetical protein
MGCPTVKAIGGKSDRNETRNLSTVCSTALLACMLTIDLLELLSFILKLRHVLKQSLEQLLKK